MLLAISSPEHRHPTNSQPSLQTFNCHQPATKVFVLELIAYKGDSAMAPINVETHDRVKTQTFTDLSREAVSERRFQR